jgi:hypothetical protein
MKRSKIEREIKQKLSGAGIEIRPGSAAARGVSETAKVGAAVVNSGDRAVRATRSAVAQAVESVREAVHEATKPPPAPKRK